MKKRLWFMLTALVAMFSFLQTQAQIPYLPPKAVLENTLASADFSTFAPKGDYTLEAAMTAGQSIDARNEYSMGFVYEAKADGLHRFVVKGATVYVFNEGKYIETIADHSGNFPDIFSGADDVAGQTGIYDVKNRFKNPGFETCTYYDGYNLDVNPKATDVRGKPADWEVPVANNVATNSRNNQIVVNSAYNAGLKPIAEGNWAFMVHGAVIPLWQKLEGLKPATWYKVTYRQMSHKDTSPAVAYASYIAKNPEGAIDAANVIARHNYYAAPIGFGNKVDVTYYFKTPEVLSEDLHFVIKRTGGFDCINHYDRMTLVEANSVTNGLSASGVSEVKYEDGAYVPEGQSYDMTSYVKNPNMDTATDWMSTTGAYSNKLATNQQGDFTGSFWENWNGEKLKGKLYQVVTGLPNGKYIVRAATFAEQGGAGFYLYGNEDKTLANTKTPTFHSVEFVVLSGTAEIGVVAEEATNQWIGLDNVTLSYLGYDEAYLTAALEKLNALIATATTLKSEKTGTSDLNALDAALAKADAAKIEATADAIDAALTNLEATIEKVRATVAVYALLETAIREATTKKVDYAEFSGYTDFEAAISVAQDVYDVATTDSIGTVSAITALQKAENRCRFTQATPFNASFLVQNPDFASGFSGWKHANIPATSNEYKVITANEKTCWNSWSNNFTSMDVYQLLEGVPAGTYSLSCYTATDGTPHDQHAYITTSTGTAISPAAVVKTANPNFAKPWESLSTTEIIVSEDGKMRIGMASTSGGGTSGWFCATGFELTCLSLANAPVAPVAPMVPAFKVPAETKPVVTGDYLIYHPDSKKFLANNGDGRYVALNDFGFVKNNKAYTWTVTVSGAGNDNVTMQQLSSEKFANTSLESWNTWDMVFDSPRADKWLLKDIPGGYTLSSLVRSKDKLVGVNGLVGNPLSVYIDKGTTNNPLFQFINKDVFFALPEIVAYSAELDAYNEKYAAYNAELALYNAKKVLTTAIEEANTYALTDPARYGAESKAAFSEVIDNGKTVYLDKEATLETVQAAVVALKEAQLAYRLSIIASDNDPADFTFMVVNPTFTGSTNGWISDTDAQNKQLMNEDPNREIAFNGTFLENWKNGKMGDGKIHQMINGLPKGKYRLKLAAFNATGATADGVYIFANESESLVNNLDPAYHTVEVNVMNGTLEIGLRIVANSTHWVGIDNASLTYLGYNVGVLVETLNACIAKAEAVTGVMQTTVSEALAKTVVDAKAIANESSTQEELEAAIAQVNEAIDKANSSVSAYAKLNTAISVAGASSVATEEDVVAGIQVANNVYAAQTVDETGIDVAINTLKSAVNATIVAKAENGDVTILIANPNIEQTADLKSRPAGWQNSMNKGTIGNFTKLAGTMETPVDTYLEAWNNPASTIVFDYNQVLSNIPNGVYVLKAATFTEDNSGNAVLYANKVTAPMKTGLNGDTFKQSGEVNTELTVTVTNDTLRFGVKTVGILTGSWNGADNFRLTYLGTEEEAAMLAIARRELKDSIDVATALKNNEQAAPFIVKAEMNKLTHAIATGTTALNSVKVPQVTEAVNVLKVALADAKTSVGLCTALAAVYTEARSMLDTCRYDQTDGDVLKEVLDRNFAIYTNQTDETDNAVILAAKTEIEAALELFKTKIWSVGIHSVDADEVKIYVDGSSIVVEGADYEIYTQNGICVTGNVQFIPGIYIVKAVGKTVKVQVK